jgi:Family of unknown function (DUF5681)
MNVSENNAGALKRRANLKPFAKGQSGNPGGRPKAEHDVVAIAREKGPDAIRTLAEIMLNAKASESARVSAANSLLERGFGKPTQPLSADPDNPLTLRYVIEMPPAIENKEEWRRRYAPPMIDTEPVKE